MGYFITTKSRKNEGVTLFLVNRNINKKIWWTESLDEAIHFRKKEAAEYSLKKLRYNDPKIITLSEAIQIEKTNIELMNNKTVN